VIMAGDDLLLPLGEKPFALRVKDAEAVAVA
jgi:hypothetical protein